ncbi:glycosyltransferase family 4 protein [Frankia sp. AgPm24]|uniref:glycosyltransferase family 4 protein n=1 Tax=Frankia sp. AgPm24 TaxID=631128 RepID=UPI0020103F52|nr:glycosyltransferase family 4 protein [Frankia sp. AgPm24]MCK9923340.1 glycosyltransferase family 4 protein [Frankia sp. AgPm24]
MRIAQIAPLWESVPPAKYGAVEALVADLSRCLVAAGHEVTVFASGDSLASGRLVAGHPRSLNADDSVIEPEAIRLRQLADVLAQAAEFDVIHSHLHSNSGLAAALVLHPLRKRTVHTLHCYANADNTQLLNGLADNAYIAISDHQRASLPRLNWRARIYHGLDVGSFPFRAEPDEPPHVAFLGRLRPDKRPDLAIAAARDAGIPIRIAGRVKPADRSYFESEIAPHVDGEAVRYLGELAFADKVSLLGSACATLVTSGLPEPFGLVTAESQLCGTPVVATRAGAIDELVEQRETGFIANDDTELPDHIHAAMKLDRTACRNYSAQRFALPRMAAEYLAVYEEIASGG